MSGAGDMTTAGGPPKRRLRAVLAADVANFSGQVSVNETRGFFNLSSILRIGREELDRHDGKLVSMPGDGLFSLFESAVSAVHCGLALQERLAGEPNAGAMLLRIGIHLGEVLFDGDTPFGETLNIAARLESLADPGGILVSGAVVDAIAARVSATFEHRGVPRLKNIPRRIVTYSVKPAFVPPGLSFDAEIEGEPLDHTMRLSRRSEPLPRVSRRGDASPSPAIAKPSSSSPVLDAMPQSSLLAQSPPPLEVSPADPATAVTRARPSAREIGADQLAAIAEALAVHLGPVARVIVARKVATATSLPDLLAIVEATIPNEDERRVFRGRLRYLSVP